MHNLRLYALTLTGVGCLEVIIVQAENQGQAFEIAEVSAAMGHGYFDTVEVKDITDCTGQAGVVLRRSFIG